MIEITKKDVLWGYLAQIISLSSGLIILPLVLEYLSPDEIGLNYLMLSLGALVSLFDFGFTPQFSRNISYIFSGVQSLKKEGVVKAENSPVNYRLLATMVYTAKYVYRRLGLIVLLILLSFGTYYIDYVTNGFRSINLVLLIWVVFSVGIFFNIYFSYYSSLLTGKGLIKESKKAIVYSKIVNILLTYLFIYLEFRLLGVVLANLIAPFVSRVLSHRYFFTSELKNLIGSYQISNDEKIELLDTVWHNAKKIGLVFLGSYAINKLSIFLAGIFLPLSDIGSYGLMMQLFGLLSMVAGMFFNVYEPRFSSLRAKGDDNALIREFAFSMNIYYFTFIFGAVILILGGPYFLFLINSQVTLPSTLIMLMFSVVLFLEGNHSNFATLIVTGNSVPFVKSALIAGFFIGTGDYVVLQFTNLGIAGLVIVQGFVQLIYANWRWPHFVLTEFNLSLIKFLNIGMQESLSRLKMKFL